MSIFGNKPWFQSWTAWGTILFGAAKSAEATGLVDPGATQGIEVMAAKGSLLAEAVGGVLVALGLRRASN
jgi:hypothetical protein